MKRNEQVVLAGALALLLAGGSATGAFAQNASGSSEASPTEHDRMMEDMHHGDMSAGSVEHGQMMKGMDHGEAMGGMDHGNMAPGAARPDSTAAEAYRAANAAMHAAMDIELTGDADIDFVRGMIGHHQGAIEMAQILLEHGKDPELRQLAEAIIAAQEAEVAFLEAWRAQHDR